MGIENNVDRLVITVNKIVNNSPGSNVAVESAERAFNYTIVFWAVIFIGTIVLLYNLGDNVDSIYSPLLIVVILLLAGLTLDGCDSHKKSVIKEEAHEIIQSAVKEFIEEKPEELREFTSIVNGNKKDPLKDLIEIQISPAIVQSEAILKKDNISQELDIHFKNDDHPLCGYHTIKFESVPLDLYFGVMESFANNSGGEYIKEYEDGKDCFVYDNRVFSTLDEAKKYIDSVGESTDSYKDIKHKDKVLKSITLKLPKDSIVDSETKLNELVLKYLLTEKNIEIIKKRYY